MLMRRNTREQTKGNTLRQTTSNTESLIKEKFVMAVERKDVSKEIVDTKRNKNVRRTKARQTLLRKSAVI